MARNENVDFLLDIMKTQTSTRQEQQQLVLENHDNEVRDQPPKTPPKFDYYGNPIGEHQDRKLQRMFQERFNRAASAAAAAASNAALAQQRNSKKEEDFSEFLEAPPIETYASMGPPEPEYGSEPVERGCISEFGQFLKVSLCCATPDDALGAGGAFDNIIAQQEQGDIMEEINNELKALRTSKLDAKTSKTLLEFQLRSELAEVRRQKKEMEQSYRREIAREMSETVLLKAKLESKMLAMMEERVMVEIQLDKLNNNKNMQIEAGSTSSSAYMDGAMVPAALCTPMSNNRGKFSPLSILGEQPSPIPTPSTRGKSNNRVPIEPSGAPMLLAPPQVLEHNHKETTPFGLSIVVENSASHPEAGSILSSTPNQENHSVQVGSDPGCDPEGSSIEEIVKDHSRERGSISLSQRGSNSRSPLTRSASKNSSSRYAASE
mmetsp:Transcript_25759/g.54438  ORF Transcript_25759/g.54438 Transcript_25759/m.54438 type:complete len:435 (-) Transcript_25759:338-1642(-)